ncbi:MAG: lipoate--protein ligase [Verrucomicrobiota bacterium]
MTKPASEPKRSTRDTTPLLVVRTTNLDPWRNLAVEEYLLDQVEKHRHILFLWQGDSAVIVGKNQNPWRECRVEQLQAEGAALARRLSGGGAVFHDKGNLNFAFFVSRTEYDVARQFDVVLSALRGAGVSAERMNRNSLAVGGRKVSGSAFFFRRNAALHHGTVLVSSNLEKLNRYLVPSRHITHTRAVRSQPSPVANLAEFVPGLSILQMEEIVMEAFRAAYGGAVETVGDEWLAAAEISTLRAKYASWDWRFGLTPPFDIAMAGEFDLGHVRVKLYVEEGIITYTGVSIEGRGEAAADLIEEALRGCPLEEAEIRDCLLGLPPPCDETVARQMATWIANV